MPGPAAQLDAIVIGHVDYGEADRIVHLLTPNRGRVSALARRARQSLKRFGGSLDLGNRLQVMVRRGRGDLDHLDAAELVHGRPHVRDDLVKMATAAYACELVGAVARAEHPEPRLFGLLDVALLVLDAATGPTSPLMRMGLEAKALAFAGLRPSLDRCVRCVRPLEEGPIVYRVSAGGVMHESCGGGGEPLTPADARLLEEALRTPLADLVDRDPPGCSRWVLFEHLCWHTGRTLKSRALLASVE
ncbi:MAG: DNA repair protein RecO [Alphaproteobacteria bacterium]|nr:DNA repair protein RecO [Alphaproteobacteria bacterium]